MSEQTITLTLPQVLYEQLKLRADAGRRSVSAEVLCLIADAVPLSLDLPAELSKAMSPLTALGDEDLWQTAKGRLPAEDAEQLERLNHKQQREGLDAREREAQAGLLRRYERILLVRARSAALLRERGHDVSSLLASP